MKIVVQRVSKASVQFDDQINEIGRGIVILLGLREDDFQCDADYIVSKALNMRLFDDEAGRSWAKSVMDIDGEVLVISQFTLYGHMKGNKPDYHLSMSTEPARAFYIKIIDMMTKKYSKVKPGFFGEHMSVNIVNDGPVTIVLDSREEERSADLAQQMAKIGGPKAAKIFQKQLALQQSKDVEQKQDNDEDPKDAAVSEVLTKSDH